MLPYSDKMWGIKSSTGRTAGSTRISESACEVKLCADESIRRRVYSDGRVCKKEHPVEVRFIEMMPIGMGKACQGKSRDELLELLEKAFGNAEPYEKHLGNGPAEYVSFFGIPGQNWIYQCSESQVL